MFLYLFILTTLHSTLQAQQFSNSISIDILTHKKDLPNRINNLKNEHQKAVDKNDTTQMIKSLLSLSTLNRIHLEFSNSFSNSGEALFLAEELKDALLLAKAHEEFGILNYLFKQDNEAGSHFKKSLTYYSYCSKKGLISTSEMFQPYYNVLLFAQRTGNKKMLKMYIDSCNVIIKKTNKSIAFKAFLKEKEASMLMWDKKTDAALHLINESVSILEKIKNNSEEGLLYKSFLIINYTILSNIYKQKGDLKQAKEYILKAINTPDNSGELTFYKAYVYNLQSEILFALGDNKNAYISLQNAYIINETFLNPRKDNNQNLLTVKSRYKEELFRKNEQLNKQNLELIVKSQEALRFRIFFFLSIFLLIIAGMIVRIRMQNLRQKEEKELNSRQQQHTQEMIEVKNKELTLNMLQLIEKEEVIKQLSDHLQEISSDSSTKALLKTIEKGSVNLWDAFNTRFIALNDNFYERLQLAVPDLSSADLKICALIKLNFSGKEMAYLLGISLGSVHVARHRLRKKMNLERDENLTKFINSI